MSPHQVPLPPPLRGTAGSEQSTKTGILVEGTLRCPDDPQRRLTQGNGTVMRCPACGARVLPAAGGRSS